MAKLKQSGIFDVDGWVHRTHSPRVMLVINALTPVFLIVALGAWLQKSTFVSPGFLREANRVTYWLGLPALLFSQLVSSLHEAAGAEKLLGAMFLTTGLAILAAYAASWLMRVPEAATGTFVQGAFRGNLAFVGLPIIFALPDVPVLDGLSLHSAAVIAVAPTMVLYNVGGVIVLTVSQHALGPKMIWPVVKQLAVTPPLLATVAGISFVALGWTLPRSLAHTLGALGEMALPLGLLSVGGSLVTAQLTGAWKAPLSSAVLKSIAGPLIGLASARWFGLGPRETVLIMILAAAPTAIVSYTMAVELKGDEKMASATIALSVVTSLVALAVIVGFFPV
ncbi:MAG: AEC family transporter [Candidatus Didemnitutus sp.]|nr:AEC family transporter [Candidatus Didemnitutus sp.]